jgi:carbamoyltransferase
LLREQRFPHSLGLLYSAFTYLAGFKVNSGEYKLMGLAPYGEPKYVDLILDNILDLRDDGSFRLDMRYFNFLGGLTMTNERFDALFGGPPRKAESDITRREMDIARSIQAVTEEIVVRIARYARSVTGERAVCLAGGVALNCVANGVLLRSGLFDKVWIQPASGDAGGALGAAMMGWYGTGERKRTVDPADSMKGAYLGPSFSLAETRAFLDQHGYVYEHVPDSTERAAKIAELIAQENVIGLFQGRMEFGPRALGHRSIIGDARSPKMQSVMNLKTKFRESFRPFAPSVLEERSADYFELDVESPYMMLVAPVRPSLRKPATEGRPEKLRDWVNEVRSTVPAITHVDYSARVQTVNATRSPRYYEIIKAFEKLTTEGLIINTSFNVRGEPIVCTPEDAYRCFMRCAMDYLVLDEFILAKASQPPFPDSSDWKESLVLD